MATPYEKLLLDPDVYPTQFVEKFGRGSFHWNISSDSQNERSLCHDMICLLLCNTRPKMNLIPHYKRKLKSLEVPSKRFKGAPNPDPDDEDTEMDQEDDEIESESDYSDEKNAPVGDEIFSYRCLEGNVMGQEIQTSYARKWGTVPTRKYDIVSVEKEQFIEVKVTTDPRRYTEAIEDHIDPGAHYGMAIVNIIEEM